MTETIYTAIFETAKYVLYLQYEPGPDGAIFIVAAEIVAKPISQFQEREATRRKKRSPRGSHDRLHPLDQP